MKTETVMLKLSAGRYSSLQELAAQSKATPTDLIATLVDDDFKRRAWLNDLTELRDRIARDDAPQFESDPEQFIEQLRQPRREIFDAEYVHLYR